MSTTIPAVANAVSAAMISGTLGLAGQYADGPPTGLLLGFGVLVMLLGWAGLPGRLLRLEPPSGYALTSASMTIGSRGVRIEKPAAAACPPPWKFVAVTAMLCSSFRALRLHRVWWSSCT